MNSLDPFSDAYKLVLGKQDDLRRSSGEGLDHVSSSW